MEGILENCSVPERGSKPELSKCEAAVLAVSPTVKRVGIIHNVVTVTDTVKGLFGFYLMSGDLTYSQVPSKRNH